MVRRSRSERYRQLVTPLLAGSPLQHVTWSRVRALPTTRCARSQTVKSDGLRQPACCAVSQQVDASAARRRTNCGSLILEATSRRVTNQPRFIGTDNSPPTPCRGYLRHGIAGRFRPRRAYFDFATTR